MNHLEAKKLVDTLGLTPAESLALRAVAWHETNYGTGWKDPEHDAKNNMGAITTSARTESGECLPQDFSHGDSRREGEGGEGGEVIQYTTCFKGSATPLEGFKLLQKTLYTGNRTKVKEAAKHGLFEVASEMRNTSYYLGTAKTKPEQIAAYHGALDRAAKLIVKNTGEAWPWVPKAPTPAPLDPAYSHSGSSVALPILRQGAHGPAVELFFKLACNTDTMVYGPLNLDSVRTFQAKHSLKADGVIGPATWAALLRTIR